MTLADITGQDGQDRDRVSGWLGYLAAVVAGALFGGTAALALRRHQHNVTRLTEQLSQSERRYLMLFENMNEVLAIE